MKREECLEKLRDVYNFLKENSDSAPENGFIIHLVEDGNNDELSIWYEEG